MHWRNLIYIVNRPRLYNLRVILWLEEEFSILRHTADRIIRYDSNVRTFQTLKMYLFSLNHFVCLLLLYCNLIISWKENIKEKIISSVTCSFVFLACNLQPDMSSKPNRLLLGARIHSVAVI